MKTIIFTHLCITYMNIIFSNPMNFVPASDTDIILPNACEHCGERLPALLVFICVHTTYYRMIVACDATSLWFYHYHWVKKNQITTPPWSGSWTVRRRVTCFYRKIYRRRSARLAVVRSWCSDINRLATKITIIMRCDILL